MDDIPDKYSAREGRIRRYSRDLRPALEDRDHLQIMEEPPQLCHNPPRVRNTASRHAEGKAAGDLGPDKHVQFSGARRP